MHFIEIYIKLGLYQITMTILGSSREGVSQLHFHKWIQSTLGFGLICALIGGSMAFLPETEMSSTPSKGFSSKDLIYFVMTDRFKDGTEANNNFADLNKHDIRAYHGGDFVGLTQSLDYIKSLGTTAIWITPVVKNETKGYHGYWAIDFETTDPHLGTPEELKTLVDEAHKKGMKVILDYVVNHTGPKSPWLEDPEKKDWFHPKQNINNWSDLKEVENNWLMGLPDLNTENPVVSAYFLNNALSWIEKTGVDGMRLDTMRHVPRPFWKTFSETIKAKYPDFYLLGEVWNDNVRYLQLYNDEGIDGLTDYSLYKGITGTFSPSGSSNSISSALAKAKFFKNPGLNGIFIDNHDNPRYISTYGKAYTKQALGFIMTYPSIPIIYYGTELGMPGKGDPDNRRDMAWADVKDDNDMLSYYKQLEAIRTKYPAVTQGSLTQLKTSKDVLVYKTVFEGKGLLITMNLRNKALSETVSLSEENEKLNLGKIVLNEGDGQLKQKGKTIELELSPQQIVISEVKE